MNRDYKTADATAQQLEVDGSEIDDFHHGSTGNDRRDMRRMGKRQELIRNFGSLSALSFTVVLQATWEFLLMANTQGLMNGGLPGLFYSYLWTFIGFAFVIASMAEMASMAPTAGGQYHWVSEFAPAKYQKPLSYLTGWMSTLSWQAGTASGSFLTGTIIQALIQVNYPDYEPTQWQGTLCVFAMTLVLFVANVWGAKLMPLAQNLLLYLHLSLLMVIVVILWAKAPHQSASVVFGDFQNGGAWSLMGLSLMVGQISAIYAGTNSDATAHMSEEIVDSGRSVPIAMFWSFIINGILALIFLVAYVFAIPSVNDAINDPTTYPFIYVFRIALPTSGVNGLTVLILIVVIASNIDYNASTSRQTFAFARDNGLPFSKWIAHIHPEKEIPVNAIAVTCMISALLALINIGSTVAFDAMVSLSTVALTLSYSVSISCVLHRRLFHPELLLHASWSLGRLGVFVNSVGLIYVVFAFFWSFWPQNTPVNLQSFNWAVVIFLGIFILSMFMYLVGGRKTYSGPVTSVQGRQERPILSDGERSQ